MRPLDLLRSSLALIVACGGLASAETNAPAIAHAVQNRDHRALKVLLTSRADVNIPSADGTTALHWAAHWREVDTAKLLLSAGANVNAANRYGATALWMASSSGDAGMVETLLGAGADPNLRALRGEFPLMAAARTGSVASVNALLARGADVNANESWRGQTALMWAVGGHEAYPEVVRALIEHGADVHTRSSGGLTALFFAVRQNDQASTRLLLTAGADVNDTKAPGGATALLTAINNGYDDLAVLLLENGANPRVANSAGFSPLHTAIRKRGGSERTSAVVLKALLAHGADPNVRLPLKKQPPNFNPIAYPAISDVDYGGATPLWIAANNADLDALRILVAAGADPKIPSMENTTPLMVAAGLGYGLRGPSAGLGGRRIDTQENVIAVLTQLLEWGSDVNALNDHGQSAIHGAAASAAPNVVQFLADHGARIDQKDSFGRTPLVVAADNRTDKYRSNQELNPALLEPTYAVLVRLSGGTGDR
jgi:ankyrin repeat protein